MGAVLCISRSGTSGFVWETVVIKKVGFEDFPCLLADAGVIIIIISISCCSASSLSLFLDLLDDDLDPARHFLRRTRSCHQLRSTKVMAPASWAAVIALCLAVLVVPGNAAVMLRIANPCQLHLPATLLVNVTDRCDQRFATVFEGDVCDIGGTVRPTPPHTSICFRCAKINFLPDGIIDVSGADGAPAAGFPQCPAREGPNSRGLNGNDGGVAGNSGDVTLIADEITGTMRIRARGGAGGALGDIFYEDYISPWTVILDPSNGLCGSTRLLYEVECSGYCTSA